MIVKKGHNPNVDSYSAFFDNKKVNWATPLLLISASYVFVWIGQGVLIMF